MIETVSDTFGNNLGEFEAFRGFKSYLLTLVNILCFDVRG